MAVDTKIVAVAMKQLTFDEVCEMNRLTRSEVRRRLKAAIAMRKRRSSATSDQQSQSEHGSEGND